MIFERFRPKNNNKRNLLIGTRETETKKEPHLPAVEVDNEVIWVNKAFKGFPLKIKEGERTKLGLFLTPDNLPKDEDGEKPFNLEVSEEHHRSALLGRVIFKDEKQLYRDIDLKGIGAIDGMKVGKVGDTAKRDKALGIADIWGILDKQSALDARDMSEKFLEAGIRTERYIAIIKLKEIVDETGKRISIDEAKKRGILESMQEPVVALRAFGDKDRVEGANIKNLENVKVLVVRESGIEKKNFSSEEYLKWFAEAAGKNLALIHKNGWVHNALNGHNITLDCRIIDLDSVESVEEAGFSEEERKDKMKRDFRSLNLAILDLQSKIFQEDAFRKKLKKIYLRNYLETLGYRPKFIEKS